MSNEFGASLSIKKAEETRNGRKCFAVLVDPSVGKSKCTSELGFEYRDQKFICNRCYFILARGKGLYVSHLEEKQQHLLESIKHHLDQNSDLYIIFNNYPHYKQEAYEQLYIGTLTLPPKFQLCGIKMSESCNENHSKIGESPHPFRRHSIQYMCRDCKDHIIDFMMNLEEKKSINEEDIKFLLNIYNSIGIVAFMYAFSWFKSKLEELMLYSVNDDILNKRLKELIENIASMCVVEKTDKDSKINYHIAPIKNPCCRIKLGGRAITSAILKLRWGRFIINGTLFSKNIETTSTIFLDAGRIAKKLEDIFDISNASEVIILGETTIKLRPSTIMKLIREKNKVIVFSSDGKTRFNIGEGENINLKTLIEQIRLIDQERSVNICEDTIRVTNQAPGKELIPFAPFNVVVLFQIR